MDDASKTKTELLADVRELRRRLERSAASSARQLAVERVHSAVLAMRSDDDLRLVAAGLFTAIRSLHPGILGCNLAVVDEQAERIHDYAAKCSPSVKGITWTSPDLVEVDDGIAVGCREYDRSHPNFATYLSKWRRGEAWTIDASQDGWDRPSGFAADFGLSRVDEEYFPPELEIVVVPFEYGSVSLHATSASEEVVNLVGAFAEAVQLGYVRFMDFRRLTEARERLINEYERSLQRARELQQRLMPQRVPRLPGYDFAASCMPARLVGGDMYKAYMLPDGRLVGFLADATGHAMEAAIPLMIFAGVLDAHVVADEPITRIFERVNQSLCSALPRQTFLCLSMGILEPETRRLTVSNSGCPYPYYYSAASGQLHEIALDGFPLGVSKKATYRDQVLQLGAGDRTVFCSDGIAETVDPAGEMFGFDRLAETIEDGCHRGLSVAGLRRHVIRTVRAFQREAPQADDMTIIVVGVRE